MDEKIVSADASAVEIVAVRIGAQLRSARELKGLSVADVAAQIRLAPRQIEALEADDMAQLPELPFVRGFVRSYAKLLNLDALPLLAALPDPYANSERHIPRSVEVPFNVQQLSHQQSRTWMIAAAIIALLALAFALWSYFSPVPQVDVSQVAVIELPVPVVAAVSAPVDADDALAAALVAPITAQVKAPLPMSAVPVVVSELASVEAVSGIAVSNVATQLSLSFSAESWAEITDSSGTILSSRHHQAGTQLSLKSSGPYQVVIGNASSVQLYRRGKLLDLSRYINPASDVARLTVE